MFAFCCVRLCCCELYAVCCEVRYVRCSLLVVRRLLICCPLLEGLLFVVCCLLCAVCRLSFLVCCFMCVDCGSFSPPFFCFCFLFGGCCLFVACLRVACGSLVVVCVL